MLYSDYDTAEYVELIHNAIMVCDATITITPNGQYVYAYVDTLSIALSDQLLANEWYHSEHKDGYYMAWIDSDGNQSTHSLSPAEMDEWENTFSQFDNMNA